jgi:hypothetical protein
MKIDYVTFILFFPNLKYKMILILVLQFVYLILVQSSKKYEKIFLVFIDIFNK